MPPHLQAVHREDDTEVADELVAWNGHSRRSRMRSVLLVRAARQRWHMESLGQHLCAALVPIAGDRQVADLRTATGAAV